MHYFNALLFNIYYILEKKYKIKQINKLFYCTFLKIVQIFNVLTS